MLPGSDSFKTWMGRNGGVEGTAPSGRLTTSGVIFGQLFCEHIFRPE
jgi:hypothetical protein